MRIKLPPKIYIVLSLIIFFVLFSLVPTIYEWQLQYKTKPVRYFELVHNFPTDYNLYLSKIRQGKEGAWLAHEKYTSEPHAGSLSQILYVFIGRISDWVHVQTPYVWFSYHVSRVFFAMLLLWMMWKIAAWVFPRFRWQLITFVMIVTASTWPKFEWVDGAPRFGGYMPWYTVIDSLQRTTLMPHVLLGQAMMTFILWVFSGGFITRKHPGNYIFLSIIGIILGIIFPPALFFIYAVLGLVTVWDVFSLLYTALRKKQSRKTFFKIFSVWMADVFFGRAVFILMTFPTMIYYAILFTYYPWKRLVEFDILHPTRFSYIEYYKSLGATLPLGLLGGILALTAKKDAIAAKLRICLVWLAAWFALLNIFAFIPQQSPTRFTQMAPHIPLGILTLYLFYRLRVSVPMFIRMIARIVTGKEPAEGIKKQSWYGFASRVHIFIPVIIILFALGSMFSSWLWQRDFVDHKLRADIPLVPQGAEVMYPLRDIIEALTWLQVYSNRSDVVFSGGATGNLIPVYSGNTAYVGHANTVRSEEKLAVVGNFYRQHLSVQEEMDYIRAQNINYIFYGPEEAEMNGKTDDLRTIYPTLELVYQNGMVKIYRVH